jgi:two-component sensor histidine kinase
MEHFVASLHGRIRSMASSHELLSRRRWEGMPLAELVQRELAPYMRSNNTEIDGPEVLLRAEAGQSMAFVLHELTTNAAKYGALAKSEGRVSVKWHWPANEAARERLIIEWQESGTPAIKLNSARSGYGTSVIRQLIPHELGGKTDLVITPEGARCRMELPGHWVERETMTRAGNRFDLSGATFTNNSVDHRSEQ